MEIDRAWAENYFVVRANLSHARVHNPDRRYAAKDKKVFTAVPVWNDLPAYDLFGVVDCLEAVSSKEGGAADLSGGRYGLCIGEYKPTQPRNGEYREEDEVQLFAQKICVDFVFGGNCRAELYYADVKKRVAVPFGERFAEYDALLKNTMKEMRANIRDGRIPPVTRGQKCSGCSMKDLCMPKIKKQPGLRRRIEEMMGDDQ